MEILLDPKDQASNDTLLSLLAFWRLRFKPFLLTLIFCGKIRQLDVSCYGREQEDALSGAIVSATAKLLLRSQDVDNILREVARDRSRKTNLP